MLTQFLKAFWPEKIALLCPCCREYADVEIHKRYKNETVPGDLLKCSFCNLESTRDFWAVEGFIEEMHISAEIGFCQTNINLLPNKDRYKYKLIILKHKLRKLKTGK